MESVWLGANFDQTTRTKIRVVIEGPAPELHEFVSSFFLSMYGTDLFAWSADRLSGDPLVVTAKTNGEELSEESPRAHVQVDCECQGRPPFEDLIFTSKRLTQLTFSMEIDHFMVEGTLEIKGGEIVEQSFIDWTESDEELMWIPEPDEPWKPRPLRE